MDLQPMKNTGKDGYGVERLGLSCVGQMPVIPAYQEVEPIDKSASDVESIFESAA